MYLLYNVSFNASRVYCGGGASNKGLGKLGSYFREQYGNIKLPIGTKTEEGLRRARLGAVHAVAAHFTLSDAPAIVVMPTGSGKTAVLMLTAFMQRAVRVLVVTPSVLVRNQVAEQFRELTTLRSVTAVPEQLPGPSVFEVSGLIRDSTAWEQLRDYDVVVGTPNSLSPATESIPAPPGDLFDLILVDEAHHGRAKTWEALLAAFPQAREIHFTATPFRNDKKELKGTLVYTYPLSEAYRDDVFGEIEYVPVEPDGEDPDLVIAKTAEQVFLRDRQDGFEHLVMVRTDSRKRADYLKRVYSEHTDLDLRLIHSGLSPSTVKKAVDQLRTGSLDGIICVDMLGEGFDLPTLKIAAVHAPHRSLAVTLQFIGRFARTKSDNSVSTAKFVAVPSEIEVERQKLYQESETWQQIVTNLSEGRVQQEVTTRQQLAEFERVGDTLPNLRGISPHAFRPLKHFKVYRVLQSAGAIDLNTEVNLPAPLQIVERWNNENGDTTVFVTQERRRPEWTPLEDFYTVEYDLFAVFYDADSRLLFINASRRSMMVYERIADAFTEGEHRILPLSKMNNVLATLQNLQFSNVGMRRRTLHPNSDSYRISAGSNTQNSVSSVDGQMYNRGHVSCAGTNSSGLREYIGYSSASKVWSVENVLIPELVGWARTLAWRIENFSDVKTGSGIDNLSTGQELSKLPRDIIAVDWPNDVYANQRYLRLSNTDPTLSLLDFDIDVDRSFVKDGTVRLNVAKHDTSIDINYTLSRSGPAFEIVSRGNQNATVKKGREEVPLVKYLREYPPPLFLPDFSRIDEGQLFSTPANINPFDQSRVEIVDWGAHNVNIRREFYKEGAKASLISIHDYLATLLPSTGATIIFYDHGSGEMADFVTISEMSDKITCTFYHCKGSSGPKAGSRTKDVYEVASQVVKSLIWIRTTSKVFTQVESRNRSLATSKFLKGDNNTLKVAARKAQRVGIEYEMVLVQPGISRAKMKLNVANPLASADRFIVNSNCNQLKVWGSP